MADFFLRKNERKSKKTKDNAQFWFQEITMLFNQLTCLSYHKNSVMNEVLIAWEWIYVWMLTGLIHENATIVKAYNGNIKL